MMCLKKNYNSAVIAIYELNNTAPLAYLYCFSYLRTCAQYDINIESIGFDKVRITLPPTTPRYIAPYYC